MNTHNHSQNVSKNTSSENLRTAMSENDLISVQALASLSGVPENTLKKELFGEDGKEQLSLKELREVMSDYVNAILN